MCKNFFENMHRILVYIRSDIYNSNNVELLKILVSSIAEEWANNEMINAVFAILPGLRPQLLIQDGEKCRLNEDAKKFILQALYIAQEGLKESQYDLAYDIVDMLHVFPHIIIMNDKKQIKNYWKIYVKPIVKKRNIKKRNIKKNWFTALNASWRKSNL